MRSRGELVALSLGLLFLCQTATNFRARAHGVVPAFRSDDHGSQGRPMVRVNEGLLAGGQTEDGKVNYFKGIPFARAPVGKYRWKPPAAPLPWEGILDASEFGPACIQVPKPIEHLGPVSEDCLTLNVWIPSHHHPDTSDPLPVFLWMPGGGYIEGSPRLSYYDGEPLLRSSKGSSIIVTVAYRLGPFGFLAHSSLTHESGGTTGLYGLLDQRQAFKWVRENIHAFGGDSQRITIAGESAGSSSVCLHMVMPKSWPYFDAGIMESAACTHDDYKAVIWQPLGVALAQGDAFAVALGCGGGEGEEAEAVADCMREVSSEDVLNALPPKMGFWDPNGVIWMPIVDEVELPKRPSVLFEEKSYKKMPLLIGVNTDEGTNWTPPDMSVNEALGAFTRMWGDRAVAIFNAYNQTMSGGVTVSDVVAKAFGDWLIACNSRDFAQRLSQDGMDVYMYHFDYIVSWEREHPEIYEGLGVHHFADVAFVFANAISKLGPPRVSFTPQEVVLANEIVHYWQSFVSRYVPSSPDAGVEWPKFQLGSNWTNLKLGMPIVQEEKYNGEFCKIWNGEY